MTQNYLETDVLVIGGGGAGFRAAIGAAEKGAKVTLLSKGPLARCGASPMAGADFTLDGASMSKIDGLQGDPSDSMEKVFNDIVTQGSYLNNQKIVQQYVERAPQCLRELLDWGVKVKLSDERMIFTSGLDILDALLRKARSLGVTFWEDIAMLDLVLEDGAVAGGLALDVRSGEFIRFKAKAVVMASGGWHKAFWPNTGMRDLSGDGMAMAMRAGAKMGNMEFITFCCNVFYDPPIWRGSLAPYVMSLIVGGKLTNSEDEEFLNKYDPFVIQTGTFTEWNKSVLSHASMQEIRAGKAGPHGGIFYSRGDVPWENIEMVASIIFPKWKYKAIDLSAWAQKLQDGEPVEVGPAVEYFEGGICVNEKLETTIPGLFAAGECTLGAFGSNRIFSAITEMLVHGVDAGENAAEFAKSSAAAAASDAAYATLEEAASVPLTKSQGANPAKVRRRLQEAAHAWLGPIRSGEEMDKLLGLTQEIKENDLPNLALTSNARAYNKEWVDALELPNLVLLLETSVRSALARTESRGVHFREDHPETDNDNWLQESVAALNGEAIEVGHRPITQTAMAPPGGKHPYFDFVKQMMESRSDTGGKH
ncbi:Putative succinate dehydrogenase, flavoprotein subunit A [Desulfatibacillum aliphaticivorans]|uniref:Succinate dehydrogenase, flavoprotein subunit A n=1 Tax=Desulfatibacillum aliphaticivorans TaxID=218208 RepID=B8FNF3_DESAL|nr:FAD-binding protein [Desulfatibacillum aliphaticivorans]ACL06122.1 Putative succinate dehydrogenase, flavoprotein subunit A [Desulfatibacillum aliphaticivorans]